MKFGASTFVFLVLGPIMSLSRSCMGEELYYLFTSIEFLTRSVWGGTPNNRLHRLEWIGYMCPAFIVVGHSRYGTLYPNTARSLRPQLGLRHRTWNPEWLSGRYPFLLDVGVKHLPDLTLILVKWVFGHLKGQLRSTLNESGDSPLIRCSLAMKCGQFITDGVIHNNLTNTFHHATSRCSNFLAAYPAWWNLVKMWNFSVLN